MAFFSWSRWFRSLWRPQTRPIHKRRAKPLRAQPQLENLESRLVPGRLDPVVLAHLRRTAAA